MIVYKLTWPYMIAQAILMRTQFMTLTNLMGTDDIRKKTWAPSNAEVDDVVMPEYMTTGNPSAPMAANVVRWLSDESAMSENVARLDEIAKKYAKAGATKRAAEYLLKTLGVERVAQREAA